MIDCSIHAAQATVNPVAPALNNDLVLLGATAKFLRRKPSVFCVALEEISEMC